MPHARSRVPRALPRPPTHPEQRILGVHGRTAVTRGASVGVSRLQAGEVAALHPKVRGRGTGCHCRGPAGDGVWRLGQSCGLSPDLGLGYGGPESSGAPSTGPHCSLSVLSVTPGLARTLALAPRHRAAPASFGTCLKGSVASLGMLSPLITEGLHLSQRPRLVSGTGVERTGKYDALRGGGRRRQGGERPFPVTHPL